ALGNALVVEVHDLFAEDEVLQQGRTARALPERILVVGDRHALVGGQPRALAAGLLLVFAAAAARRVGLWIGIGAATHGSRGLAFGGPCVALWLFTGCGGGGGPGRGHARAPAGGCPPDGGGSGVSGMHGKRRARRGNRDSDA